MLNNSIFLMNWPNLLLYLAKVHNVHNFLLNI